MKRPTFVHPLSGAEREALEAGLRSSDAFVLRQILLASSGGENAYRIARSSGCDPRTARTAIERFDEGGSKEPRANALGGPRRCKEVRRWIGEHNRG